MVSYEFYVNQYKGSAISETDWPGLSARAADVLERYKRYYRVISPKPDGEDMALCAMAEGFQAFETGGAVKAAEIGSISVTYGDWINTPRGREQELYRRACQYLEIYRGKGNS